MTIEQALKQYVTEQPSLSALIGTRFYPMKFPQNTAWPAGRYQRISGPRVSSHEGPSRCAHPRVQIDWGYEERPGVSAYEKAVEVANAARQALDGFRGRMVTIQVSAIRLVDERDFFDPDVKVVGRSQDYIIWHEEESKTWL